MKLRYFFTISSILILLVFNFYEGHAGFQDFLKDAKKFFNQDEGLTDKEIVNGLKQALKIGTSNSVRIDFSVPRRSIADR